MNILNEILKEIEEKESPILIGISGFGGAGKTTLAKKLSNKLDAQVVHVDDFAITNSSGIMTFSLWNMMDYNRLEKEVLKPYTNNESAITFGKYDWDNNIINENIEIIANKSIIVEGVGLFRPQLLKYFDFTIWVDCEIEESIKRGMKRAKALGIDNDLLWNGLWKKNDLDCFEKYKPLKIANFIYNNKERKS